jgi:hypothetical protein
VYQLTRVPDEIFAQKAEAVWKRRKLLGPGSVRRRKDGMAAWVRGDRSQSKVFKPTMR